MTKILIDEAVVRQAQKYFNMIATGGSLDWIKHRAGQQAEALRQALKQPDCDHDWKYIGSKRQAMRECTKCGMYKVPDEQPSQYGSTELQSLILARALPPAPAQENSPWCMKMNGCKTKCEDCPDEVPKQPAPAQPPCKTHPEAPHGFLRNDSHNLGRYVCECEHWEEPEE